MSTNRRVLPKFAKAIDQSKLMKKRFSPVACVIDPLFEKGTMNMISAAPNTWKSWLVFLFANNIASGSLVFNKFKTEKTNVIIVNEEDSERLIKDRLRALKIQPNINVFYRVSRGDKLQTDYVDYLIAEAKKLKVGVIFFDSLRAMHDEDENSSMAMQRVMDLFKKITREGITVIFTHHNKKNNGLSYKNSDAEAIRGSTAINAAISGHISLEEKNKADEKLLIVKHVKSKIGEKLKPFLIKITIDDGVRFDYAGNYNPREDAWVKIKEEVISIIKSNDKLLARKDFVALGFGKQSKIKDIMTELVIEGKVDVINRGDAVLANKEIYSDEGKANELLYYIHEEDDLD